MSGPDMNPLGQLLFADVETYAQLPFHLTGTEHDHQTIDWLADCLATDGATVEKRPWTFPRWTATWSAELDGTVIDSLPVFYEAVGTFASSKIDVVATAHPGGLLTVNNRHAAHSVGDTIRARLLVAGRYADREKDVRAHISGAVVLEGRSANIAAGYGCQFDEVDVLVATPISGWFSCASERGTGIAVARWLAHELAAQGVRVGLLATSGHELFNIGLERQLAMRAPKPSLIVHVGASVAARQFAGASDFLSSPQFSDMLVATTNQDSYATANLASIGFQPRSGNLDPKTWIGEGTRWCTLGSPLLSVAGMSHWFHTPDDRADIATHPNLLAAVATALLNDVGALLEVLDVRR
jgi:hypothetical protein